MHSLPIFVRLRGKTVAVIGEGQAAAAKTRLVERAGGHVVGVTAAADAALVFIALDDADAAARAAAQYRALGKLINVVDRPELCDFTTPAIVDRDPVLIAVSTGGASAGLAKHIRLRLEALLPPSLGLLAERLFAARDRLRHHWPDGGDRRRAIDTALAPDGPLDPLRPESADRVAAWAETGELLINPTPSYRIVVTSDDPDDLSLRDARMLGQADRVVHASNIPAAILARARADASFVPFEQANSAGELDNGLTVWLDRAP
jgi:uroporphyrin-III C-methyltransferase/precorrin-2 dehydrogenase/sirohydrochlorin ferrochelatase